MKVSHRSSGNLTALIVVCIGVLALLIAFFALNYGQLFGTHKEAQTAIDAAALQAARDIGRIVVPNSTYGLVALVDDVPVGGNFNSRPVWGVNTLLATARLDILIAKRLGPCNAMLALANADLAEIKKAGQDLATAIDDAVKPNPTLPKDKAGLEIAIRANAEKAYTDNKHTFGGGAQLVAGTMQIEVGRLTGNAGETNIPLPWDGNQQFKTAGDPSLIVDGVHYYVPYAQYDGVTMAAVADKPKLVPNNKFELLSAGAPGAGGLVPAVVRVQADEAVQSMAPGTGLHKEPLGKMSGNIHVAACAQAGGPRITHPSGVLSVEFPQGFPPNVPIDFTSIKTIMKAGDLSAGSDMTSVSPTAPWFSRGNWFQAQNGPVPPLPAAQPVNNPGTLVPKDFRGRSLDNPAIALNFMVYDWLKACGLRPNIAHVADALSANMKNRIPQFPSTTPVGGGETFPQAMNHDLFMPVAYAQRDNPNPSAPAGGLITGGTTPEQIESPANSDPQSIRNQDATTTRKMLFNWSHATPPGDVMAQQTPKLPPVKVDSNGDSQDMAGHSISNLVFFHNLYSKVLVDNAEKTYEAAKKVVEEFDPPEKAQKKLQEQIDKLETSKSTKEKQLSNMGPGDPGRLALEQEITALDSDIAKLKVLKENVPKILSRAKKTKAAARLGLDTAVKVQQTEGALTKDGVDKIGSNQHSVKLSGDVKFYAFSKSYDAIQIKDLNVSLLTGQDAPYSARKYDDDAKAVVLLQPTVSQHIGPAEDYLLQPALAQGSSTPFQTYNLEFTVIGDSSRNTNSNKNGGGVRLQAVNRSPFSSMAVLEGQYLWQALGALQTGQPAIGSNQVLTMWRAMAMDLYANNGQNSAFYSDKTAPGHVTTDAFGNIDNQWCQKNPYTYSGSPTGASADCYQLVARWSVLNPNAVCVPTVPFCCAPTLNQAADGTVTATASSCPPPPTGH